MTTGASAEVELGTEFQTAAGLASMPPGTTIGGLIVDFNFRRAASSTVTESGVAWGILPLSSSGLSAPSAVTGTHDDWMWLESVYFSNDATLSHVSSSSTGNGPRRIKAMRRLDEVGMQLHWVSTPLVAAETITGHITVSTLLILP